MHQPLLQPDREASYAEVLWGLRSRAAKASAHEATAVTSREEPQPKLSPAIMMGYLVAIDPSSTDKFKSVRVKSGGHDVSAVASCDEL